MAKGWRNESRRHSLASKGIKTAVNNPKEKAMYKVLINPTATKDEDKAFIGAETEKEARRKAREWGLNPDTVFKDDEDNSVYSAIEKDQIITKKRYDGLSKEEKKKYYKGSETDRKLLEQKQLLLMKSGIPIGRWERKTDLNEYIVWGLPQEPMRNPHNVVIKKEWTPTTKKREWVAFVDMGDGGTSVLNRGGTMGDNLLVAKDYMIERP